MRPSRYICLLSLGLLVLSMTSWAARPPKGAKAILNYVHAPEFRSSDYLAEEYGVVPDGTADCRSENILK